MIKTGITLASVIIVLNVLVKRYQKGDMTEMEYNKDCPYKIEPK